MRLLNTANLKFEDWFPDGTPEYAILSHRWETGEEVSYEEIHSPAARKKKGYAKIRDFCDKARSHGYDYVWVDTCCINKKDFTELAEAVNSMFSWYRNSHTCFTYLSDFVLRPGMNQQQFVSELARSQWFCRGWTLQELIAPANVEFYDSNWHYFGSKRGLAQVISVITGISKALLEGRRDLKTYSCAQKMSWAANRQTTRPEDRTYSLLGLFGVSLPLIYDGHGSRAFKRLQEEIIKSSTDQSIFAWVQHGPSPFVRGGRTIFDQECSILAPSPDYFRFSSHIVGYERKALDTPYSLSNIGLDITQQVRKVISSGERILLEVLLDCYDEARDRRVSIAVVGAKSFYSSVIAPATEYRPKDHSSLPVSRVEPRFLGLIRFDQLAVSKGKEIKKVPLQISPISVDTDHTSVLMDVSWMNDPQWEVETRKKLKLAREHVQDLHEKGQREDKRVEKEEREAKREWLGIVVVGGVALTVLRSLDWS